MTTLAALLTELESAVRGGDRSRADGLVTFTGEAAQQEAAASQWLLK